MNSTWDDFHDKLVEKFHKISNDKGVGKNEVNQHLNIFEHKI